jgi:hypothetical protein
MVGRLLAFVVLVLTASGCASSEVRAQCPNWTLLHGCGSGYTGPPRPTPAERMAAWQEREYPTKILIVDGQAMHPATGKPINCAVMAPFEERLEDLKNPVTALFRHGMWGDNAMFEIRGWKGYAFGIHGGHIDQGIAMSRACRALLATPASIVTPSNGSEAPDWCRGANQEWLGVACLTRTKAE